jgi:hypothetical protein
MSLNARIQRLEALWEECWEERLTLGLQILKLNEKHRTISSEMDAIEDELLPLRQAERSRRLIRLPSFAGVGDEEQHAR